MDDGAGQPGVVGVDDERVPVLAEQDQPAAGPQRAAGLAKGLSRVVEHVVELVGAVAGQFAVGQRQGGGRGEAEVGFRMAAPGGGDHLLVEVHADRAGALFREFRDGPARAAAHVGHRLAGSQMEQVVGA